MKTTRTMNPDGGYTEVSDVHQNSIEIAQTAKGDWYTKSIKVFEDDPEMQSLMLREATKVARARVAEEMRKNTDPGQ